MNTEIEKYNKALQKAIDKINNLTEELNEIKHENDIAVIGYNCRFPAGANSAEEFWKLLLDGYDAVTEVPDNRFDIDSYYEEKRGAQGKTYTKQGAFLDVDIKAFDALHFGILPTEAVSIDPQHRLLLEVCWEAMENAGLDIEGLRGSNTGVFIGMDGLEYAKAEFLTNNPNDITPYSLFGISQHAAAGRLSYFFDFKGPSFSSNTACSSSLVALNSAVESLKKGECDMAIIGGVNLILTASSFVALSQIQALSPDGRSKAFDASADGYGRGEGCGVLILKRESAALKDGDCIQAIIKSSYVGQDGKANGFFAPNGLSEQRVLRQGLSDSGLGVDDIDYMETHGTGTSTGDFIESSSICEVYKDRKSKMLIGSVKSNIGHLEAASGIAGVIKVLLSMKYHKLPPSIHVTNPNPSVNWDRLTLVDCVMDWENYNGKKRVAAVSSFGISGTLAHIILEEPDAPSSVAQIVAPFALLTFSAKSENALKGYLQKMAEWLSEADNDIQSIAYATNREKSYLKFRCAFVVTDKDDAVNQIRKVLETEEAFSDCCKAVSIKTSNKKSQKLMSLSEFSRGEHTQDEWKVFYENLKKRYLDGTPIDFKAFYKDYERDLLLLPNYCFQRKTLWKEIQEIQILKPATIENEPKKEAVEMNDAKTDVLNKLREIIHDITGMDMGEIDESGDLFSFGFDSLMLMSMGEQIKREYDLDIAVGDFFTELNSLEAVSDYILKNQYDGEDNVSDDEPSVSSSAIAAISADSPQSKELMANMHDNAGISQGNIRSFGDNDECKLFQTIFDNQCKILSEQNELMKNLIFSNAVNGKAQDSGKAANSPNGSLPDGGSDNSSYSAKDIEEEREKKDYFVPYRKIDVDKDNGLTDEQYEYWKKIEKKFIALTHSSKDSTEFYRPSHANARNTAGFTKMLKEMTYQIVAKSGKGSKITDLDGNEFLDLTMGFGVNLFGHAPKFITDALKDEINNGFPLGPMGRLAGVVAKQICDLTGNERVFFCNSGTEAVMFSLRIARAITGRNKIVIFAGAYHGTYDGILGMPMILKDGTSQTMPMVPGITKNAVKDLVVLNYNTDSSLEYIEKNADEIAGVLVETVQSRRPDVQPKEYLKKLRKLTSQKEIALIFDEVITGFRIGAGGAQEFYGIAADLVNYGKIVGGGMPIGIVAGKKKFMDSVDGGMWNYGDDSYPPCIEKRTMVAGTFCHHGLAMAAANAVLTYIKENKDTLYEELNSKTKAFADSVNAFFKEEGVPFTVVNFGSLFRFYNVFLEYDIFYYSLISKGIYIWEGRNCFFSTEHRQEDIDRLIQAIKDTVYEMKEYGYFKKKDDFQVASMSSIQKRLYSQILISDKDPFDLVSSYFVNEPINVGKLGKVIEKIIDRHEILRTGLVLEDDSFKQIIHKHVDFAIKCMKVVEIGDVDQFVQSAICCFDLQKPPLFEVLYVESEKERPLLVFHFHHTVADGLSMAVFVEEVSNLMKDVSLPALEKQYREYSEWEIKYRQSDKYKKDTEYWIDSIKPEACHVSFAGSGNRTENPVYACKTIEGFYDKEKTDELKMFGRKNGVSIFMVLLAGINLLIHKAAYQKEIAFITPTTNRFEAGFEKAIGMFSNMSVLTSTLLDDETISDYIKRQKMNWSKAYQHFNYPFEQIINDLKLNDTHAFNIGIVYENADQRATSSSGMDLEHIKYIPTCQEYDLKFEIEEEAGALYMYVRYREDVLNEDEAKLLERRLALIYEQMVAKPDLMIEDLQIAFAEEKKLILESFNQTISPYPREKTIIDLFQEQAEQTPDKTAMIHGNVRLSYSDMNKRVNQLANALRDFGISRDNRVVILGNRSANFVIAMYAVMKSGGAYVPVDPTQPLERIRYIINDCQAKLILSETEQKNLSNEVPVWNLKDAAIYADNSENPHKINAPNDLVYCIYTSGTTGKPKGVMVEHRSVVNYTHYGSLYFSENNKVIPLFTNCCFDLAGTPLFLSLCYGSTLEIIDINEDLDIAGYLQNEEYDCLKMTPSHLKMALESKSFHELQSKKHIVVGGEILEASTVSEIFGRYGQNLIFHNEYGPTEATIGATAYLCNAAEKVEKIPIGKPLDNIWIYIMNGNVLCGIDMVGEICIGGDCLARGYMNLPELTSEKFVDNPFGPGKIYRSGDLAKWKADGNLEYIVRADEQVKIRGFRIEIAEIENALQSVPEIESAAVVVRENHVMEKELCAYLVAHENLDILQVRSHLATRVPDYMIPAFFMQIDEMPITKNGKADKKKLPEIVVEGIADSPKTNAEQILCEVCEKVLGMEKIDLSQNFFAVGGDSIKAVRITSKMAENGYGISIKDVMRKPTLADVAKSANLMDKKSYNQDMVTGDVMATPIIKEFASLNLANPAHYNQAVMYRFTKNKIRYIEKAVTALMKHHDILRAVYSNGALKILSLKEVKPLAIETFKLAGITAKTNWVSEKATLLQGGIDLANGPLIKVAVFEDDDYSHVLICLHHLIVDGISWRIFTDDFVSAIEMLANGKKVKLPEKTASFIEWSKALAEYGQTSVMKKEYKYWDEISSQIAEGNVVLKEKGDKPGLGTLAWELDEALTDRFIHKSNTAYHTEINDLFLAIIGESIHKLTGQEKITVGLEGHGREPIHKKIDIYRTIGWFTCKYPVIVNWKASLEDLIIETKEMLHRVPNHGIGYGLYAEEKGAPSICVYFNYMGEMDLETEADYLSDFGTGLSSASENKQQGSICINAFVSKKKLKFRITYDYDKASDNEMHKLKKYIMKNTKQIADFCAGKESEVKTASDYGASDMQIDEFAELMDVFE